MTNSPPRSIFRGNPPPDTLLYAIPPHMCANTKSDFVHYVRECARRGFRGRSESPLNKAIQSAFLQADCGKMVGVFSVGARPLLQGVPSFKQSTGLFEIQALPLTRQPFLREKAGPKNLSCLWQALIGRSDPHTRICLSTKKENDNCVLLYK